MGSHPVISGRYAYWTYAGDDFIDVLRTPLAGHSCRAQSLAARFATTIPADALNRNFATRPVASTTPTRPGSLGSRPRASTGVVTIRAAGRKLCIRCGR